jgi:hypothetical protein
VRGYVPDTGPLTDLDDCQGEKRRLPDHDRTNGDAIKDVQFRITFTAPEGHDNQWAT